MRVLVLGDSASTGKGISKAEIRWPLRLPPELETLTGERCEVIESPFFATSLAAPGYAAKKVESANPDVIILVVGGYGFRLKSVHAKVKRRFGERPARVVRWVEDKAEGPGGIAVASSRRKKLFEMGQKVAHRVIGTERLTTPEEALDIYTRTFSILARREATRVITMHYKRPAFLGGPERSVNQVWDSQLREDPELEAVNDRFVSLVQAEIESRHFEQVFFSDHLNERPSAHSALRLNTDGHEIFARMVAEKLATPAG